MKVERVLPWLIAALVLYGAVLVALYVMQDRLLFPRGLTGRVRQRGVTSGRSEVVISQAALGGICIGSASGVGVISSAMPSSCM
jgi:hypothetical protein